MPCDMSGPSISRDCLKLFMVKKAVYVIVWDADRGNAAGTVLHWLEALGTHIPGASVLFVGIYREQTDEQVIESAGRTVTATVNRYVLDNELERTDNFTDLYIDGGGQGIMINLSEPAAGLALLGQAVMRMADRLFKDGEWRHPETADLLEALQLDCQEDVSAWQDVCICVLVHLKTRLRCFRTRNRC